MIRTPQPAWTQQDIEEIVRSYTIDHLSAVEIARARGVTPYYVRQVLKSQGIDFGVGLRFTTAQKDEIVRLYKNDGLGLVPIADRFKTSYKPIERVLCERGVVVRRIPRFTPTPEILDEIVRRYRDEGWSVGQLAEHYRALHKTIKRLLVSQGVRVRHERVVLTAAQKNDVVRLYRDEFRGLRELAQRFHVCKRTVLDILQQAGVPLRSRAGERAEFSEEQKVEMESDYANGSSIRQIAQKFQCAHVSVSRALNQRGVPRRKSPADARRKQNSPSVCQTIPDQVLTYLRSSAVARGHAWELGPNDIDTAYERQGGRCHYTQIPLKTTSDHRLWRTQLKRDPLAISLDRRDSSRDYTPDNVVLCCRFANLGKNAFSEDSFREALRQTVSNLSETDHSAARERTEDLLAA